MERGGRIKDEIIGLLAVIAGLVVVISLVTHNTWDQSFSTHSSELNNLLGRFGSNLSDILLQSVGYASYIFPAILFFYGARKVFGKETERRMPVFVASIVLLIISSSSFIALAFGKHSGGTVGYFTTEITVKFFSATGSYLLFITLMLVSLMYIFQLSLVKLLTTARSKMTFGALALTALKEKRKKKKEQKKQEPEILEEEIFIPDTVPAQEPLPISTPKVKTRPVVKKAVKRSQKRSGDYELPSPDLLHDAPPSKSMPTKEELLERSELLKKKLMDYSVEGKITHVSPGPIVTMFEFEPAAGIKISKVMSLAADLSMALKASSIRIAPIHGKSTLGIEVPNKNRESVFLKDMIADESYQNNEARLTLALGKDIFGIPVMTDLAKMPHLLMAGATGSGKSVGMNSIVLSLLFRASPKEVKMLMIDPKMLELSAYEDIPHLLMPVITLPKEASNALKKLVFEMERRYRLLADSGARSIDSYNKRVRAARLKSKQNMEDNDIEPLPYIVIFIDELADLMFASGKEVEESIARLAGMARAAGIHLVLATQRPSVDVITGIIKANFPSRISFQVSSKMDSRIILDTYGADQLLGKGDMLFTSPGKRIKRVHGAYVSEEEIRDVADFVRSQAGPDYTLFEDLAIETFGSSPAPEEQDELYSQARDIVISAGKASISSIQRAMKIGYNRAARIMDMLEEEGIVGPPGDAGKPREVIRRQ